jgi:hypothetical protein
MLLIIYAAQNGWNPTETASDITVWLILVATILAVGGALLALGRKVITGPIQQEQRKMSDELLQLTKQVTDLAIVVAKLVTDVAVIKERQSNISQHLDRGYGRRHDDT